MLILQRILLLLSLNSHPKIVGSHLYGKVDLLQKCFLQELGKGKRLKRKGTVQNLYPFPLPLIPLLGPRLPLFPTNAKKSSDSYGSTYTLFQFAP